MLLGLYLIIVAAAIGYQLRPRPQPEPRPIPKHTYRDTWDSPQKRFNHYLRLGD